MSSFDRPTILWLSDGQKNNYKEKILIQVPPSFYFSNHMVGMRLTPLLHNRDEMPADEVDWWKDAITRLLNHEPAQYIVGQAPFYGRTFKVNKNVLIPEAETAELIDWVLQEMPSRPLKVLDLGTGSGVIGITLALERPNWHVSLRDISPAALAVAQENMAKFNLELPLIKSDLFENIDQQYDLIVTNPPYIDPDDTGEIDQAVLENEPALALFANERGLGFLSIAYLSKQGST